MDHDIILFHRMDYEKYQKENTKLHYKKENSHYRFSLDEEKNIAKRDDLDGKQNHLDSYDLVLEEVVHYNRFVFIYIDQERNAVDYGVLFHYRLYHSL